MKLESGDLTPNTRLGLSRPSSFCSKLSTTCLTNAPSLASRLPHEWSTPRAVFLRQTRTSTMQLYLKVLDLPRILDQLNELPQSGTQPGLLPAVVSMLAPPL